MKLKEVHFYEISKKSTDWQDLHAGRTFSLRKRPNLQKFFVTWNVGSEWYSFIKWVFKKLNTFRNSMNDQGYADLENYINLWNTFINLTSVGFKSIR